MSWVLGLLHPTFLPIPRFQPVSFSIHLSPLEPLLLNGPHNGREVVLLGLGTSLFLPVCNLWRWNRWNLLVQDIELFLQVVVLFLHHAKFLVN